MSRKTLYAFKGLLVASFPEEWLQGMDFSKSFACVDGKALVKFGNGRAFEFWVEHDGPTVTQCYMELAEELIEKVKWGEFCAPFESYERARLFGFSDNRIELN